MTRVCQAMPGLQSLAGFGHRWLPFADAASADLSLGRLLRLYRLFQLSTGMAIVLLTGTLNRVMVVELGQATTSWVSLMLAIPLLLAPAPRPDWLSIRSSSLLSSAGDAYLICGRAP